MIRGASLVGFGFLTLAMGALFFSIFCDGLSSDFNLLTPAYIHPWWAKLQEAHADGPRNPNSKLGKDFRKDFRVPFKVFQFIVDMAKSRNWMSVAVVDACGRTGIPIELQILGVLYILGVDHKFRSVEKLGNFSGPGCRVEPVAPCAQP